MSLKQKNRGAWFGITIVIFLAMCLFLFYPLAKLFISAFQETRTGEFTFGNFLKFASKPYYYKSLFNSINLTVIVTLLCCVIGIPMAYVMSHYDIKGKRIIEILIIVSLLSPPFIGAYSWIILLGRNGIISNMLKTLTGSGIEFSIYGFNGIVIVFTLKLYAYVYMYAAGGLSKIDVSLTEAAENLGCHPIKKIFNMIIPLILPSVMAGALIVFANTFTDFGTPMMIGEGYRTMPVLVYQEFVGEVGGSANYAAALSIIMLIITIGIFMGQRYITDKKSFEMNSLRPITPVKPGKISGFFMHFFIYLFVLLSLLPQITVIVTSFKNMNGSVYKEGWGFQNYVQAFSERGFTIVNTYKLTIISVLIILVLGIIIAYVSVRQKSVFSSILDVVTMFPLVISGTVLGITLLMGFNSRPLRLTGTSTILIIALVIRRLPYTIRSSSAVLKQLSPSVEEASISLGCSPIKTFLKITGPLMLSGVFAGLVLSWVTLITELSASIILYTGKTQTMGISIYLQVYRNEFGMAAALASILTITIIISLALFFKISGKKSISL